MHALTQGKLWPRAKNWLEASATDVPILYTASREQEGTLDSIVRMPEAAEGEGVTHTFLLTGLR